MSNMDCPEGKDLRSLENQLDKNKIKLSEAQHIQKIYQEIIQKLQVMDLVRFYISNVLNYTDLVT